MPKITTKTKKSPSKVATVKTATKKPAAKRPAAKKSAIKSVTFKKDMTRILLGEKSKIVQEVSHKIKDEANTSKSKTGDIYDIASSERERELSLTLGDRDRGKLPEIEDALERLEDGSYGECEECEEPIAQNRLRILPFTRVCVECQSKLERDIRIKGSPDEERTVRMLDKSESEEDDN
jgi:DnaK suppressor protein